MKNKWNLIGSIFQLAVGTLAIISFIILVLNGEVLTKWIITLLLAMAFVAMGISGIKKYKSGE